MAQARELQVPTGSRLAGAFAAGICTLTNQAVRLQEDRKRRNREETKEEMKEKKKGSPQVKKAGNRGSE